MTKFLFSLFFGFVAQGANAQCKNYTGNCQADWMQNLPTIVKKRPLAQLKFIGTHDSGSYRLTVNATPPMETTPALRLIADLIEGDELLEEFVGKLTLTQSLNIYQQLEQGSRALDLRLTYSNRVNQLYISHSFMTVLLSDVLSQIKKFMTEHTGEVLAIELRDDTEHTQLTTPYNNQAVWMVRAALGSMLIPVTANKLLSSSMTLENLVAANQRILFIFGSALNGVYGGVWEDSIRNSLWPNGQSVNQSLSTIEANFGRFNTPQNATLNTISFTITPTEASLLGSCDLVNSDLASLSSDMRTASMAFIQNHSSDLAGLGVVYVDFPTDDYIQQIINWNIPSP